MQSRQANVYQKTAVYSGTMDADPHSLITQMLDGALTRIAQGKGSMLRKDIKTKAELISKAITIIGSLEGCLDHDVGGELSQNLSKLYEYMCLTLTQANINNDTAKLDEVSKLLLTIKSGWVQIPEEFKTPSIPQG
jgi:flagellar protein FliS